MSSLKPKIHLAGACALLVLAVATSAATAAPGSSTPLVKHHPTHTSLAGKWSGKYSGAFTGTFTLQWTLKGSHLNGTITLSNPGGTYKVTGSVHSGHIQFGAVGVGATYTGKVSGKSMSGNYQSPKGGGPWSAHKTS